jgi:methionyl-tRNA synthetase
VLGVTRTYLTTTIPYVNARPHVGFALELVQADVLARHRRLRGTRSVRLSRYTGRLRSLIESGALRVEPAERRNEVLAFIAGGLEDFSVSRSTAAPAAGGSRCRATPAR